MKYVFVEGRSDEKVIKEILRKLDVNVEIRKFDGKEQLLHKYNRYAQFIGNYDKIIGLIDSNCSNPMEVEEDAKKKISNDEKHKICIAIHNIASWLLGDEKAISKALLNNRELKQIENPEISCKPEEEIDNILKINLGTKVKYHKTTHAEKIAKYLDIETVKKKCPSFAKFIETLKDC